MVLQLHFASQFDVAQWIGARDRLTFWMVAEMPAIEVLFEVTASRESLKAITNR